MKKVICYTATFDINDSSMLDLINLIFDLGFDKKNESKNLRKTDEEDDITGLTEIEHIV